MKFIFYLIFSVFLVVAYSCQMKPYAHFQSSKSEIINQNRMEFGDKAVKINERVIFQELSAEKEIVSFRDSVQFVKTGNIIFEEKIKAKHFGSVLPKDSTKKTKLFELKPATPTERRAKTAGKLALGSVFLGILSIIAIIVNSPIFFLVCVLSSMFFGLLALFYGKPALKKLDKLSPFRKYAGWGNTVGILYLIVIVCMTLVTLLLLAFVNSINI